MDEESSMPEGVTPIPYSEITPNDVLCGRGGSINTHVGNERFRRIVESKKRIYLTARFKREKRLIAASIVEEIHALKPPGRFLTKIRSSKNDDNGDKKAKKGKAQEQGWYEVEDEKARDKTSQALRENAPEIRKEMEDERKQYMIVQQQKLQDDDDYDEKFNQDDEAYYTDEHSQRYSAYDAPVSAYSSWMPAFPDEKQVTESWNSLKTAATSAVAGFMPYGAVPTNQVSPDLESDRRVIQTDDHPNSHNWSHYDNPQTQVLKPFPQYGPRYHSQGYALPQPSPVSHPESYGHRNHPHMPPPPPIQHMHRNSETQLPTTQSHDYAGEWSSPKRPMQRHSVQLVTPDDRGYDQILLKDSLKQEPSKRRDNMQKHVSMRSIRTFESDNIRSKQSWEHEMGIDSLLDSDQDDIEMFDTTPDIGETDTTSLVHDNRDDDAEHDPCSWFPDPNWLLVCAPIMSRNNSLGSSCMMDTCSVESPLGGASLCNVFEDTNERPFAPFSSDLPRARQNSIRSSIQDGEIVVRPERTVVSPLTLRRDKSDRSVVGDYPTVFGNIILPSPLNSHSAVRTDPSMESEPMTDFVSTWSKGAKGSE